MGSHPINLAFRFLLELSALLAMGPWGWQQSEGAIRFLLALAVPAAAGALWGILAFATYALYEVKGAGPSALLGAAIVVHYALSYDRVMWLMAR
jgi:hypothetical protein